MGLFDQDAGRLDQLYAVRLQRLLPPRFAPFVAQSVLASAAKDDHVDFRRCGRCGLTYQDFPHTSEALGRFYSRYYRMAYDAQGLDGGMFGRSDRGFIATKARIGEYLVERTGLAPPARVLDVGCAEGHTVAALHRLGFEAHGIEPSTAMARYAREVQGLENVVDGIYDADRYRDESFDAILSHHVLEHVLETRSFVRALVGDLRTGGWLLLQLPCVDAVQEDQVARRQVYRHDHLYGFSESYVCDLLVEHGLEVEEARLTPCDLSTLPEHERGPGDVSAWGDVPCGMSFLARKRSGGATGSSR